MPEAHDEKPLENDPLYRLALEEIQAAMIENDIQFDEIWNKFQGQKAQCEEAFRSYTIRPESIGTKPFRWLPRWPGGSGD